MTQDGRSRVSSIEEVPPIGYDGKGLQASLATYSTTLVRSKQASIILRRVEKAFPLPKHLKRVRKVQSCAKGLVHDGTYLEVILGRDVNLDAAKEIIGDEVEFVLGETIAPSIPPLTRSEYSEWTGWPLKWLQPAYKSKPLNVSNEVLDDLYTWARRIRAQDNLIHPPHCRVFACLIGTIQENNFAIFGTNLESGESRLNKDHFLPMVRSHGIMMALESLALACRASEDIAGEDEDQKEALLTTPSRRTRVNRRSGSERNEIKKKLKSLEGKPIDRLMSPSEDKGHLTTVSPSPSQYYATGLTAVIYGSPLCLMCTMGLVHSRVERVILLDDAEMGKSKAEGDRSEILFESDVIRMHADKDRLNHSFTLYRVKIEKE